MLVFQLQEIQELKNLLFDNLFKLKRANDSIAYNDYSNAVENVIDLKVQASSNEANSNDLLSKARTLWSNNKGNKVVEILIRELLNKNLFYSQAISLPKDPSINYRSFLSFANPGKSNLSSFVFNVDTSLYFGNVQSDSIIIGTAISFLPFETPFVISLAVRIV